MNFSTGYIYEKRVDSIVTRNAAGNQIVCQREGNVVFITCDGKRSNFQLTDIVCRKKSIMHQIWVLCGLIEAEEKPFAEALDTMSVIVEKLHA